jgi:class 3 adenylate cyclase/tetratricopeptide (TPR) repeat protein
MEFLILGPLEVRDRGRRLPLGGGKQRALLGVLLLHSNKPVSTGRIVDELWGEHPPARAPKLVQGYIMGLRKALGAGRLVTQAPGYLVRVEDGELDLVDFERLAAEARTEPEPGRSAERLREALGLWRGPALADLRLEGLAGNDAERLNDLRLAAVLDRIDADLAVGRHAQLVGELEALVAEHPLRERPRAQLMLALYRSGRQAEALDVYRATRQLLSEQLGLEPTKALERLERLVLTQDPELDLSPPEASVEPLPAERAPPSRPQYKPVRRTVTVVFADCSDWTTLGERLDPESLHGVLGRFYETCAGVLERHGGAIEKFIGDVVVGVFGLPSLHEDDALRAVRAAVEVREAVADLSAELERSASVAVDVKVAVNSGEVFVASSSRSESFATGDTLNVCARLEKVAEAGEIILGEHTYRLVEPAVRAEKLEPLLVKGRTAPVRAWRLLELRAEELPLVGPVSSPFVGRVRELAALRGEADRAAASRECRLCTVVGAPGVGKSRLARQLVNEVSDEATVVVGRCLSYGEGITYRPLVEIVRGLAGDEPRERLGELLKADEHGELVAERVLGAIGLVEPGGREETFWAVRRLLEVVARDRLLVAVFEDVHWAEPTLLDLLEYLAGFSSGTPILLLCLARPELLELWPGWAAPQAGRTLFGLEPLPDADALELVDSLGVEQLDAPARARIIDTAEGNPLFLEQLVAMKVADEEATLPPSVQAVLAARIDRLEPGERTVLEYASVEGRSFHRGLLAELLPSGQRTDVAAQLMGLVRKQLIRPDPPEFPGEDAFRFTHVLTRDAAYAALPKQLRAELHEAVGGWLETKPAAQDEIVGYHFEQAYRYQSELGAVDERGRALAAEAAGRLAGAARAALVRGDFPAGAGLLERTVSLQPAHDAARCVLVPKLAAALFSAGRLADAERVVADAIERAEAEGDARFEACARVEEQIVRLMADSSRGLGDARRVADSALNVLAEYGDDFGLCRAWWLKAWIDWTEGRAAGADEAWRRAAEHADRAGEERDLFDILGWRASAAVIGPTPVPEAIDRCTRIREHVSGSPVTVAVTLHPLGALHAMRGDFEEADRLVREANAILDELAGTPWAVLHHEALVEMLAGRPAAAEARLRLAHEKLEEMGERALLATTAATLAQAVYAQGRYLEADGLCRLSETSAADEDLATHVVSRGVRARILARKGLAEEAEAVAREAVELVARTDWLMHHGDALLDLADVLERNGRVGAAEVAMREALELYDRKGNVVSAGRVRSRLAGSTSAEAANAAPA